MALTPAAPESASGPPGPTPLPGPLGALERFFFAPLPVYPLVIARVGFGAVLFACYASWWIDAQPLFGPDGLAGPRWFHPYHQPPPPLRPLVWGMDSLLPAPSAAAISVAYAGLLVAALCFAAGFRTRTAGVAALVLHYFFERARLPFAYEGWAQQITPLLVYVILSQAGRYRSLDAWLARRRGAPPPPEGEWLAVGWPLRLLQIHTCAIYLVAGGERLDDPGWYRGEAVWVAMNHVLHSKIVIDWQAWRPLLSLGAWGAYVLEPLAPFLLWVPKAGVVVACLLVAMHLTLELVMNVGWWSFMMVICLTAFLPTPWVRRWVKPAGR